MSKVEKPTEGSVHQTGSRINRAIFIRQSAGAFVTASFVRSPFAAIFRDPFSDHPEPREGISAKDVLPLEKLGTNPRPKVVECYDAARTYPVIFDSIHCRCSCGGPKGSHRSLLVCFETAQGTGCGGCQESAQFVGRVAREGKTIDEIRAAYDKEFGG